jgi:hypothetical protein
MYPKFEYCSNLFVFRFYTFIFSTAPLLWSVLSFISGSELKEFSSRVHASTSLQGLGTAAVYMISSDCET